MQFPMKQMNTPSWAATTDSQSATGLELSRELMVVCQAEQSTVSSKTEKGKQLNSVI